MNIQDCEVHSNCNNSNIYDEVCWHCENYSLYSPIDKRIKCKRQLERKQEKKEQKKALKNSAASKRGKRAKRKGWEGEHEAVNLLNKYGLAAERVPLSGALKTDKYSCDVTCLLNGNIKRIEVKRRKSGLTTIYNWLNEDKNSNMLMMRQDNKGWLVCMTFEEFLAILGVKE